MTLTLSVLEGSFPIASLCTVLAAFCCSAEVSMSEQDQSRCLHITCQLLNMHRRYVPCAVYYHKQYSFMVALCNRADHIYFHPVSFMVALCNRETIYIFILFLSFFLFFSSPNLSGRRLDVYHTLAHGVALVRI